MKVALPLPPLPDERAEEVLRDEGLVLEDLPRQRRGVLVREPALNRRPLVDVAVERADLPQARARVKEKKSRHGRAARPRTPMGRGWSRLAEAGRGSVGHPTLGVPGVTRPPPEAGPSRSRGAGRRLGRGCAPAPP